ncbi:MAG TPA: ABC-2 family transporter protein [Gemmataceae bacterium]|nr:ABC-2 family transporter protein [Gemmataceae bacterium]
MQVLTRYLRLYFALGRYGLARELSFRVNFLVKLFVEVLWLGILLAFYKTVFGKTTNVGGWTEPEYLFFVGCYFALAGLIEALFLANCSEFAELVRTGDLDFYLLKPIDEQFLVTCRDIDWSSMANVFMGAAVMGIALYKLDWPFDPARALVFLLMFACGSAIAYSMLLLLTSASVWFKRNQSLYELWWLFTSLMRYPREIFSGKWASPMGWFFSFVVPILLVVNVPARLMVKFLDDPALVVFTAAVALVLLFVSRKFFRYALRSYRSASS